MFESSHDDIKADFLNELRDNIPALMEKTDKLQASGSDNSNEELIELYRIVHTIRGASSLVKLNDLSQVASELEGVFEEIINKNLRFEPEVLKAIASAIEYFEAYSKQIPENDTFDQNLRTDVLDALLDARKQAASGTGHDLLEKLLGTADQQEDDNFVADYSELEPAAKETALEQKDTDSGDTHGCEDSELEDIDQLQQELQEGFYQEAEDHFQDLGKALAKLEDCVNAPSKLAPDLKELLRLIRRSVHTIKGAAAVVKLQDIAGWGHEVEDVLDWLYEDAESIAPDQIKVIADAVDILEHFVTAPQQVDSGRVEQLRTEFKGIIGFELATEDNAENEPVTDEAAPLFEFFESEVSDKSPGLHTDDAVNSLTGKTPPLDVDPAKTVRIDLAKVESVIKLAAESSIALTAFDRDMDGFNNLIEEIDRARQQLSKTARDLELGYEVKAIQQLSSNQPMLKPHTAASGEDTAAFEDFDVLELDQYSELNLIIRSLTETAVDVSTISRQLSDIYSGFDAYLNRLRIILSELNQKSMRMRMAPMSTIVNRMRRTVRETAVQLDKQVRLAVHGEHIELDKIVWEKLADPLMHLLRNAIDHGIEPRAIRQDAGKSEIATISLIAFYQGNQVVIRIIDDGAGFDYEAIRESVASSQPELEVDGMSEQDLADMVFQPGFSTRRTISEVSGRGIGLDVVKENIHELKGSVLVEKTAKGSGTTFCINLPLNMAAMQALFFDVGGRLYAISIYDIKEVLRVDPRSILGKENQMINLHGRRLPFFKLSDLLAIGTPKSKIDDGQEWPLILIVGSEPWQSAVAIDSMYGQREIVIKSLGTHLQKVKGVAGATTMGDGKVVPILNLEELLKEKSVVHHQPVRVQPKENQKNLEIMVVDDSVTIRNIVSRLIKQQGWDALTAKDGVEAIECLHTRQPDLVILDIEMPRMNGFEFLSLIRSQTRFKDLPVIMHTSRASKKHREKSSALGANAFLTKPCDEQKFVALMKRLSCLS